MSILKNAIVSAAMVTGLAAPAMADDFLAAGCIIKEGDYVVAIINHNDRHIKHDGHDKVQLPIGKNRDEEHPNLSPQEVALQQTEEETGVAVKLLSDKPLKVEMTKKGKVHIFACAPVEADAFKDLVSAPVDDIIEVLKVNPATMLRPDGVKVNQAWRNPADQQFLIDYKP